MIRSSNLSTLSAARFGCTALAVALAGGGLISAATSAQSLPPLNVEPVWTLPVPPAPPEARATGSARFSAIAVDSGVLLLDANGLQNNIDRDQNVMPGVSFGLFSSRPPLLIDSRGEFAFVRREYDDRGNSALTQIGFNGRVNWSLPFTVSSNSLAPFTDGGAVALHRGGTLHHLRASDGRIAWSVAPTDVQSLTPGAEFKSLIATESGVLIHASVERIAEDGTLEQTSSLVRLDRAGPTPLWTIPVGSSLWRDLECGVESNGDVFLVWSELSSGIFAMYLLERRRLADGVLLMSRPVGNAGIPFPACTATQAGSGAVFALAGNPGGRWFGVGADGEELWSITRPGYFSSLRAVPGGTKVIAQDSSSDVWRLFQFDAVTGAIGWSTETAAVNGSTAAAVFNDRVVWAIPRANGVETRRLDPATGAVLNTRLSSWVRDSGSYQVHRVSGDWIYRLSATLDSAGPIVRLARIDPATGVIVQQREWLAPAGLSQVGPLSLREISPDVLAGSFNFSAPSACTVASTLFTVDGPTLNLRWQRQASNGQNVFLAAGEGDFVDQQYRLGPPSCPGQSLAESLVDGTSGAPRWVFPARNSSSLTGDAVAVYTRLLPTAAPSTWAAFNRTSGTQIWTASPAAGFAPGALILPDAAGPLTLSSITSQGQYRLDRRRALDGTSLWSQTFGGPGLSLTTPRVSAFGPDTVLFSAQRWQNAGDRVRGAPWLAGFANGSGEQQFVIEPRFAPELAASAIAFTAQRNSPWLYFTAEPSFDANVEGAGATAIARMSGPNPWVLGAFHLLERQPLDRLGFESSVEPIHVDADGSLTGLVRFPNSEGPLGNALVRLPAPGAARADLRVASINGDLPIVGFAPRQTVEVVIENLGPDAVTGARLRTDAAWDSTAVPARLLSCRAVGQGTCPAISDGIDEPMFALGAGAQLVFDYEFFDITDFFRSRRGVVHVDPPFAIGDPDLTNNTMTFSLDLRDFRDSFEAEPF